VARIVDKISGECFGKRQRLYSHGVGACSADSCMGQIIESSKMCLFARKMQIAIEVDCEKAWFQLAPTANIFPTQRDPGLNPEIRCIEGMPVKLLDLPLQVSSNLNE
jgi:hypothetical protein